MTFAQAVDIVALTVLIALMIWVNTSHGHNWFQRHIHPKEDSK